MAGRDLIQRLDREHLAFRTLTPFDKVLVILTALAFAASIVQLLGDIQGIVAGIATLARDGHYGAFLAHNAVVLGTLGVTFLLWLMVGRDTQHRVLDDYQVQDLRRTAQHDRVIDDIAESARPAGRVDRYGTDAGLTDAATNAALVRLDDTDLAIRIEQGTWLAYRDGATTGEAGKRLMRYVIRDALRGGGFIFNADKVRLESGLMADGRLAQEVRVRKTDYISSLMTDGLAFRRIQRRPPSQEPPLHDGIGDFAVHGHGGKMRLRDLSATKSSNQIGVSVLAFTRDGHLLTVLHSSRAQHSQDKLAPSGSGSLDWADLNDGKGGLLEAVVRGAVREMREECGFDSLEREPAVTAKVYAFSRLLHRGGKPEFFALGRIDATLGELTAGKVSRFESIFSGERQSLFGVELDDGQPLRAELIDMCERFFRTDFFVAADEVRNRQAAYSYQLQHAMKLLQEALLLDESWQHIARFFTAPVSALAKLPDHRR